LSSILRIKGGAEAAEIERVDGAREPGGPIELLRLVVGFTPSGTPFWEGYVVTTTAT
jgi:hypothetical protein